MVDHPAGNAQKNRSRVRAKGKAEKQNQKHSRTQAREPGLGLGDPEMDRIFGGGIPRDSLYILSGPPGAGKTIFAQQLAFASAKRGLKVVYFTNVSEPHSKLIEHIRMFNFYEPDLLGTMIQIYNITSQIRDKGFKETLDFIVESVRRDKADVIIIDSFRGLKHILDVRVRDRGAIFDLAARLSLIGCTTVLVGEYTPEELQTDPEFAIADGIINLTHTIEAGQERRTLRINKMRGVDYLGGEHSFKIEANGLSIYTRQESLIQAPSYRATSERVSMGVPALDEMMYGGPIQSRSTLIVASAWPGRNLRSPDFLAAGST